MGIVELYSHFYAELFIAQTFLRGTNQLSKVYNEVVINLIL